MVGDIENTSTNIANQFGPSGKLEKETSRDSDQAQKSIGMQVYIQEI
jgi:hypothetical protein